MIQRYLYGGGVNGDDGDDDAHGALLTHATLTFEDLSHAVQLGCGIKSIF